MHPELTDCGYLSFSAQKCHAYFSAPLIRPTLTGLYTHADRLALIMPRSQCASIAPAFRPECEVVPAGIILWPVSQKSFAVSHPYRHPTGKAGAEPIFQWMVSMTQWKSEAV